MIINPSQYKIAATNARKFVTNLNKSGVLLPVVLLECTVTGGRTYQAYKRNGFVEARERITEESLAAVFWLLGAKLFGKMLDKLGQACSKKIPKNMPDVGRDSLRTPFNNYIAQKTKDLNLSPEDAEKLKKFLARFSVGKTAASLLLACVFIGIVVPKLNQAITKYFYGKMKDSDQKTNQTHDFQKDKLTLKDARTLFSAKDVSINAVENFKAKPKANAEPSFKARADELLRIVQNFEENDIWKLMGTDVGTVSGRTINARNKDERIEIMFRDITSIYFYCFSMPHIIDFMNKHDVFKGKNTKLNPMSAMFVHNHLIDKMAANNFETEIDKNVFKKFALGNDLDEKLMEKFFEKREDFVVKKHFFGLIKTKEAPELRDMTLTEFEAKVDKHIPESQRERIKSLGRKMAELMQPEKQMGEGRGYEKVLTESQVEDILRGGAVRDPEFMSNALNKMLGSKSDVSPLSNPYRYISSKKIEDRRQQILDYVQAIVDDAEKTGKVTVDRMMQLNKRNIRKNGLFMVLAMGVSSAFLSTIIPKLQYYITFLRTGKNEFPGLENINESK